MRRRKPAGPVIIGLDGGSDEEKASEQPQERLKQPLYSTQNPSLAAKQQQGAASNQGVQLRAATTATAASFQTGRRVIEAQSRASEAEHRVVEAERRATEDERRAQQAEEKAGQARAIAAACTRSCLPSQLLT